LTYRWAHCLWPILILYMGLIS